MNILSILLFTSIFVICGMSGCSDDNNILAALDGKKKQKEGDLAPFLLYQNHPNPFNPVTHMRFAVATEMHIILRVFTEDWNEVAVIVDEVLGRYHNNENNEMTARPSLYQVSFDAENLASGVYYYVLEGGGYKQIRKMRLLK